MVQVWTSCLPLCWWKDEKYCQRLGGFRLYSKHKQTQLMLQSKDEWHAAATWICWSSLRMTQDPHSRISLLYVSSHVTRTANKRHWKTKKNYTWSLGFFLLFFKFKASIKFYIFKVKIQRLCQYFLSKQQSSVVLNMASRWFGSLSPIRMVKPCWSFWSTQVLREAVSPFQSCRM